MSLHCYNVLGIGMEQVAIPFVAAVSVLLRACPSPMLPGQAILLHFRAPYENCKNSREVLPLHL